MENPTPKQLHSRGFDARKLSSTATKQVRKIVKDENRKQGERKYVWTETAGTPIAPINANAAMLGPLYAIAEGVSASNRIGQTVSPTSLQFTFNAYRGLADSLLRLIVVRINDSIAIGATQANILEQANTGNLNYVSSPFLLRKDERSQFEVLHDQTWILDDAHQNGLQRKLNIKVNARKVSYDTPLVTSASNGNIWFMFVSDNALANAPSVTYDIVARYKDL